MRRTGLLLFSCSSLLWASAAGAQDAPSSVQIHGFVSQGFIKTTENNYLAQSKRGSFDFSEVGINFTDALTDKFRVGIQLFAHELGPLGKYAPQFDWYYLDYRFTDWFGVRGGRTKLPWGLYNEANDVDAGRVPILLPQSLYPVANREFLFAQNGGEIYGDISLAAAGLLEYRAYGGTIFLNGVDTSAQLKDYGAPYMFGGRLMWLPFEGLQLGGSAQKLRFDIDYVPTPDQLAVYQMQGLVPANFSGTVSVKIPIALWVTSIEYQAHDLLLAAEYGRSYIEEKINLLIPTPSMVNQGGYGMASYRVNSWFTPGVYYSALFPDIHHSQHNRASYQHDVALTLRYDLTANWLVKLEQHYMHGTAGLTTALNDDKPLNTLTKDWGVFLVKTTAYF
ncbi:MAG TPA: hypothetical protein VGI10_29455 [Polyangiaceae bacterium]